MGKGQRRVVKAMEEMRQTLPFKLKGIDSDNGSEFINHHLYRYTQEHNIAFTRGRPYKKDDNAHVEQKNWTHIRKLFGYFRYDSDCALQAMNDLYQNELRLFQNLFQPSVKLVRKERVGSKLKRVYDKPKTPFERVCACPQADPLKVRELKKLLEFLDPFELLKTIDQKLNRIYQMANHRMSPKEFSTPKTRSATEGLKPVSHIEKETIKTLSEVFGIPVYVKTTKNLRDF